MHKEGFRECDGAVRSGSGHVERTAISSPNLVDHLCRLDVRLLRSGAVFISAHSGRAGPELTESQEAVLLGVALGGSGIGGIVFGYLSDVLGRKRIMTWTILLYSVGTG